MTPTLLPAPSRCKIFVYEPSTPPALLSAFDRIPDWPKDGFSTEYHLQRALLRPTGHPWRVDSPAEADVVFIAANFSLACAVGKEYSARQQWAQIMRQIRSTGAATNMSSMKDVPKVVSLQYRQNCRLPWSDAGGLPRDTIALVDQLQCKGPVACARTRRCGCYNPAHHLLAPFAVTSPRWLTRGRVPESTPPWPLRKLLFFGGHVPALNNDATRYLLWRLLRRDPRVTTQSHTINCTIGSFRVCSQADQSWRAPTAPETTYVSLRRGIEGSWVPCGNDTSVPCSANGRNRVVRVGSDYEFYRTFCHDACGGPLRPAAGGALKLSVSRAVESGRASALKLEPWSCIGGNVDTALEGSKRLARRCKSVERWGVDFASEGADIARDAARGSRGTREQFLRKASRHRFCLIAQGDPGNTAKITETLVLGGAGGCLPVFVLAGASRSSSATSGVHQSNFARDYPYTRWLDYCSVGYFVSQADAVADASRVLEWLAAVPPDEAAAKTAALRALRPALTFEEPQHGDSVVESARAAKKRRGAAATSGGGDLHADESTLPQAVEYVMAEACAAARRLPGPRGDARPIVPSLSETMHLAGGRHERCTFRMHR